MYPIVKIFCESETQTASVLNLFFSFLDLQSAKSGKKSWFYVLTINYTWNKLHQFWVLRRAPLQPKHRHTLTFPLLWYDAVPPLHYRLRDYPARPGGHSNSLTLLCESPLHLSGLPGWSVSVCQDIYGPLQWAELKVLQYEDAGACFNGRRIKYQNSHKQSLKMDSDVIQYHQSHSPKQTLQDELQC